MTLAVVAAAVASYLLGAIPTSFIVVRMVKHVDLRTVGSGNLGATNLFRVLGWKYAVPVAMFDALKGATPVALLGPWVGLDTTGSLLLGAAAVFGHVFSVFVNFKGGKGVATTAGVVLGLAPGAFGVTLAIWGIILTASGYVSLASIVAAMALPFAILVVQPSRRNTVLWFAALALVVIWMHRANIRRLLNGTEHRFRRPIAAGPDA
ncbi:MAG TPA: glycerol-3-phosphate 1-O-acyltransferase PlsY [Gemmatimonadales bacterium]|jgi:glycerol-3-phosphate acyltransferase PlsY